MKLAAVLVFATVTLAAQGATSLPKAEGTIDNLQFASGPSSLRVTLTGEPKMCGNAWTYSSLDETDANYAAIVQALLSARATKATVTVFSTQDKSGYCRIAMITVK